MVFRPEGDCPPTWYDQPHTGRFKLHCFYEPTGEECQIFTIHFNLFLYNRLTYNYDKKEY